MRERSLVVWVAKPVSRKGAKALGFFDLLPSLRFAPWAEKHRLGRMKENEIAALVVDAAYRLHTGLGPGIFEVVYEVSLAHELRKNGYSVERQVPVPITWDGIKFDEGFRADLIIDNCVIVEVKSIAALEPVHSKQVLTYLRLMDKRLGLLINFGEHLIKHGIKRIANGMPDEPPAF
jgi:GxxExxY protein